MILAGDVGGTKTVLALFEQRGSELRAVSDQTVPSAERESLESVVREFLASEGSPELSAACFGVAGAVLGGRANATNLPWQFSEKSLAEASGAPVVKLLNDLEAAAHGMLFLPREDLAVLQPGKRSDRRANVAVIAAGTGLGQAMLFWDGKRHHPVPSEGGHADFAPRGERQIELYRFLARRHEYVSYEHVVSGPGLQNIYRFARAESGAPEPQWLTQRMQEQDDSAVITQAALAGEDAVCADALELFVSIYGAEAGNLALRTLAVGGIFVGGGIAPKILPALEAGGFMSSFCDKGFFSELLAGIEVCVALNPRAPLIGCAQYASGL